MVGWLKRTSTGLRVLAGDVFELTQPHQSNRVHLRGAIRWLFRSQDCSASDGSSAGYNLVLGWEGPYPETTGYIAVTLFRYANLTGVDESRSRARLMCDWLLELQRPHGGFPGGPDPHPGTAPNVFNTGQIIFGLAEAYTQTRDARYLEAVDSACSWLTSTQSPEGYWDRFDYRDQVHAYSSRVAWSLLEGWQLTGNDDYFDAAQSNIDWVSSQQTENGWFRHAAFDPGGPTFLHTIAYTIRGLLEASTFFSDSQGFDAARRAADKLLSIQREGGVLRGAYDEDWSEARYYCLTGNAQMAIVWLRLYQLTGSSKYRTQALHTIRFLKGTHRLRGPEQIKGAVKGSHPVWGRYMYFRFPNWATKFFADALMLAEETST